MYIKSIYVKSLYNTYDHNIKLNDSVSLLLGDNGIGKTMTFKLVDALFRSDFVFILSVYFEKLEIATSDDITIGIEHVRNEEGDNDLRIKVFHDIDSIESDLYSNIVKIRNEAKKAIKSYIPNYYRAVDDDKFRDLRTRELLSLDELTARYTNSIPKEMVENLLYPIWWHNIINSLQLNFLDAQRVLTQIDNNNDQGGRYCNTIIGYATEMSERIKQVITEANIIARKIDSSYPKRLIEALSDKRTETGSRDVINNKLINLHQRQVAYSSVGLLSNVVDTSFRIRTFAYGGPPIKIAIMTYIKDMEAKLQAYEMFYLKVSLFLTLVNSYLNNKIIKIDVNKGIIVEPKDAKIKEAIKLDNLSSGEQNIIIMFYYMLFKTSENDVLLLDEPEISLHVVWQRRFIDDLLRILEYKPMQICIATHSPSLINSHWNLTQELTGTANGIG